MEFRSVSQTMVIITSAGARGPAKMVHLDLQMDVIK
jgi:hypothetical protein